MTSVQEKLQSDVAESASVELDPSDSITASQQNPEYALRTELTCV